MRSGGSNKPPAREARRIDLPTPGYWAVRLTRGGVEVGAAILRLQTVVEPGEADNRMERSSHWIAYLNGKIVSVETVWMKRGRKITEAEYNYLVADRAWAARYAPSSPEANPDKPVSAEQLRSIKTF